MCILNQFPEPGTILPCEGDHGGLIVNRKVGREHEQGRKAALLAVTVMIVPRPERRDEFSNSGNAARLVKSIGPKGREVVVNKVDGRQGEAPRHSIAEPAQEFDYRRSDCHVGRHPVRTTRVRMGKSNGHIQYAFEKTTIVFDQRWGELV
jgi:hypothetical protein